MQDPWQWLLLRARCRKHLLCLEEGKGLGMRDEGVDLRITTSAFAASASIRSELSRSPITRRTLGKASLTGLPFSSDRWVSMHCSFSLLNVRTRTHEDCNLVVRVLVVQRVQCVATNVACCAGAAIAVSVCIISDVVASLQEDFGCHCEVL
jgi:hypothetical protein